jgi:phosphatidate cytidylyltransferase
MERKLVSNTNKRIMSAIVLVSLVAVLIYLGTEPTIGFILFVGCLAIDEIHCNIFKKKRWNLNYFLSQAIFLVPTIFLNFFDNTMGLFNVMNNAAVLFNILLLVYLFYINIEGKFLEHVSNKFPGIGGLMIVLPVTSLTSLFHYEKWQQFLAILLIVNFGMDSGAWFFGKNFGKNKLWKAVSPNKTIEGLIGGMITSGIVGGACWHFLFGVMSIQLFVFFSFLGLMSQVGDLIQSKIKRQAEVKDSSSLIPGHGGVYDRIDSLIFLAPFYALALKYFYFG